MPKPRIDTGNADDRIKGQMDRLDKGRADRGPPTIDPSTGRLKSAQLPPNGVLEAYNKQPFAMRPGWLFTYSVRGEQRSKSYLCNSEQDARTRLTNDEPEAYSITAEATELPIET